MEECELCGRSLKEAYIVNIENVEMRTCASCAKGKKIVSRAQPPEQKRKAPTRNRPISEEEKELVDAYGVKIRAARERMKIPIKVLAEMLNEKEHMLLEIEEQRLKPTIKVTKKLEHALGIRLTEEEGIEPSVKVSAKGGSVTVGDFMQEGEGG